MSVNKYQPHIFVLPEDDANRQLAVGFLLNSSLNARTVQALSPAGGWLNVKEKFAQAHVTEMERFEHRYMILLLDFDEQGDRLDELQNVIPDGMKDRVFVLGVWSEPEKLRTSLGKSFEEIGKALADECHDGFLDLWNHNLLKHNADERIRMEGILRPILFS